MNDVIREHKTWFGEAMSPPAVANHLQATATAVDAKATKPATPASAARTWFGESTIAPAVAAHLESSARNPADNVQSRAWFGESMISPAVARHLEGR